MAQSYFVWKDTDSRNMGIIMRQAAPIVRPEERVPSGAEKQRIPLAHRTWAKVTAFILVIVMTAVTILSAIGAVLMMLSVFARGEQTTRKFLLSNALVWTVYTAIIGSTVFFAQVGAVIADCLALYKYRGTGK